MEKHIMLRDCLQLDAFSSAEVISSQDSLRHPVSCVSVLDSHFDLELFRNGDTDRNMLYMVTDEFLTRSADFIKSTLDLIVLKKGAGLLIFCKEPLSVSLPQNLLEYALYKKLPLIGMQRGKDIGFNVIIQSVTHLVLMGSQPADSLQGFFDLLLFGADNYTNRHAWQKYAKNNRINRIAFLYDSSNDIRQHKCSINSYFPKIESFFSQYAVSARIANLSEIVAIAISEPASASASELLFPALLDYLETEENAISLLYLNVEHLANAESNHLISLSKYFYHLNTILPYRSIYTYTDLLFVSECSRAMAEEHPAFSSFNMVLSLLCSDTQAGKLDLAETLAVWLLDADRNTQAAAKLLKLHPNTLQYRLKKIKEIFSFDFDHTASLALLAFALGIHRLQKTKNE